MDVCNEAYSYDIGNSGRKFKKAGRYRFRSVDELKKDLPHMFCLRHFLRKVILARFKFTTDFIILEANQ